MRVDAARGVEPELPFGLTIRFLMQFGHGDEKDGVVTIKLETKTCAGADFIVSSDTSLGGNTSLMRNVETQPVLLDAEKRLSDVRLVFNFPYCPLKKDEKNEND